MKTAESYALQLLRSRSYENYLAILFAPVDKRSALSGLYAFRQEILAITHQVKEPILGEMRLHYWQESLRTIFNNKVEVPEKKQEYNNKEKQSNIFSGVKQSPIIKILGHAAGRYNLSLDVFLRLVKAASFNLYQEPMPNRFTWENCCNDIYCSVLRSACQILDKHNSTTENTDRACHYGGLAQGLAALIYDLPYALKQRKQPIPQDILHIIGVEWASLYPFSPINNGKTQIRGETEIIKDILTAQNTEKTSIEDVYDISARRLGEILCASFWEYYTAFKQSEKLLPAVLRPAFLPLAILPAFIKRIEKQPHRLLTAPPILSPLCKQSRILCAGFLGFF